MKKNRVLLLVILFIITCLTIGYMNIHYDTLARNTYVTKDNHDLLLKVLDDEEIIYIVEHNEDVTKYDYFLNASNFEFKNRMYYAEVRDVRKGNAYTIVTFVNSIEDKMDHDDVLKALQYYDYSLLKELILNHSYYNPKAKIVLNPDSLTLDLNLNNTIGKYAPTDLIHLAYYDNIVVSDEDLVLRKEAADELNKMCAYLENTYDEKCGGFMVNEGYLSYDKIHEAYSSKLAEEGPIVAYDTYGYPSHNEHQLGLAIDLVNVNERYEELRLIAEKFGFVYYDEEESDYRHLSGVNHLRYVGKENINCFREKTCEGDE